ncbi:hypothetical protein RZ532_01075 [Nitratireductor aquimarinus]|uniref:hypothetical protein n=1 Tax=Nitratireductor aquimarinus TaxID=889300 RepID=UPI0029364A79|nr:hypothetical protein [Nitratireductor aquimarinus]MDV2964553.1 hypothetical protein [Nitratireductor aquimarinus]
MTPMETLRQEYEWYSTKDGALDGVPFEHVALTIKIMMKRIDAARTSFSGRMRRTLDFMFHKYGHFGDYRVYRGHVFVFKGDQFVTVFPLTNGLHNSKAGKDG